MKTLLFSIVVFVLGGIAGCASPEPPRLEVPYRANLPLLDGTLRLNEWPDAGKISRFHAPSNRVEDARWAAVPTQVFVCWNESGLAVLFLCRDPLLTVKPAYRDHPKLYEQDVCEIFIDPHGKLQSYWELQLNTQNILFDQKITLGENPVWGRDGRLTDDFMKSCKREAALDLKGIRHCTGPLYENGRKTGWFAQWFLPGISLYGNDFSAGQILRAQFCRYDYGTDPENPEQIFSYWSSGVLNGCPHTMPRQKGFLVLQKNDPEPPRSPVGLTKQ